MIPLILLFACFGLAPAASSAPTIPGRAEVRAIKGYATYATNGGPIRPLKVGTILRTGHTIRTGTNSTVDLFLGVSTGVIRIAENSTLTLDLLALTDTGADTKVEVQLNLPDGAMYFNVNKLSKSSRYEIKMPTGVAGIRGTKGSFNSNPNNSKPPIVLLEGTLVFVYVSPTGQLNTYTLSAPPAVSFTPGGGVEPAPPALALGIASEVESVTQTATPSSLPPPPRNTQQTEPIVSPNSGSQ